MTCQTPPVPDHPTRDDIDLCGGAFWAGDHHEALTWMRREAPVYFDGAVWGVTRYADVKDVSHRTDVFSSAGGIRPHQGPLPHMIDMDDPAHLQRRKLVNKGFTPRRVRDSEPQVRQACTEILDAVIDAGNADLVNGHRRPAPDDHDRRRPRRAARAPGRAAALVRRHAPGPRHGGDRGADAGGRRGLREYNAYAAEAVAARRTEPQDDLMSVLVHAEVDGDRLSDEEVVQESLLILIGGDETTRHVISGGIYQLLRHPDQWQRLAAEPDARPAAVEEMLRWVTPIKNMVRTATRDVELHGQTIHEGDELMLLYPSANRDEDVFDDPFRFDIARTPNDHLAFGFGTHFCLGASLARLEIAVMLDELLARTPNLRLADPDAEPQHRPVNFISGIEHLKVEW